MHCCYYCYHDLPCSKIIHLKRSRTNKEKERKKKKKSTPNASLLCLMHDVAVTGVC